MKIPNKKELKRIVDNVESLEDAIRASKAISKYLGKHGYSDFLRHKDKCVERLVSEKLDLFIKTRLQLSEKELSVIKINLRYGLIERYHKSVPVFFVYFDHEHAFNKASQCPLLVPYYELSENDKGFLMYLSTVKGWHNSEYFEDFDETNVSGKSFTTRFCPPEKLNVCEFDVIENVWGIGRNRVNRLIDLWNDTSDEKLVSFLNELPDNERHYLITEHYGYNDEPDSDSIPSYYMTDTCMNNQQEFFDSVFSRYLWCLMNNQWIDSWSSKRLRLSFDRISNGLVYMKSETGWNVKIEGVNETDFTPNTFEISFELKFEGTKNE